MHSCTICSGGERVLKVCAVDEPVYGPRVCLCIRVNPGWILPEQATGLACRHTSS